MTEMEWINSFADNLAMIMYESKLTQKDLSEMTGISESTISKYLRKQQMPGIKAALNIAYVLSCSLDDLLDYGEPID